MVSQITLGNFFTQNGRTVLGGVSGSGLDTESLIEGLTTAKRIPAKELEDKIEINKTRELKLGEFKSLLSDFKDAANFLRNPPGFRNATESAFRYASPQISSNTSVAGSNYISATVSPGALVQSYTINEISSIAKASKQNSDVFSIIDADASVVDAGPSAGRFGAGTFTFKGQSITLDAGDSLNTVVSKFNALSDATSITASIVQVSSGQYSITFAAKNTGFNDSFDFESLTTVTADVSGVLSGITFNTSQVASNAVFKIDGVEIIRQSNSIADVVPNVTFNLLNKTTTAVDPTELSVNVVADNTVARNGIINFVNAYNELRSFFAEQTKTGADGLPSEDAVLSNDSVFRSIISKASQDVGGIVKGLVGSIQRIGDLGISIADLPETATSPKITNILNVDDAKLTSALASNFDGVRKVFEFNFSSNNVNLTAYTHIKPLSVNSFTLNIDPLTSTYEASYLDGNGASQTASFSATAFTDGSGYTLVGNPGTVFDGLTLLYGSNSSTTIVANLIQGIADGVFNSLEAALNADEGTLTIGINDVANQSKRYQDQIKAIDENIAKYRDQLIARYSALESALSRINTILQSLEALSDANNSSS